MKIFSCRNFFIIGKSFPQKQPYTKNFYQKNFLVKLFYLVALENHFLKNSYPLNIFIKKCLVEIF